MKSTTFRGLLIVLVAVVADSQVSAQNLPAVRARARAIEAQIAEIRGREFKRPVELELNGRSGYRAYLERKTSLPGSVSHLADLDRYVRKLGLYRGEVVLERSFLFLLFAKNFGKDELASDYDPVYDLNQDGQVNFPDYLEFVRHFGRSTS